MTFRYQITGLLFVLASLALAGLRRSGVNLLFLPPVFFLSIGIGLGGAIIFGGPRFGSRFWPRKDRRFGELNPSHDNFHTGLSALAGLFIVGSVFWVSGFLSLVLPVSFRGCRLRRRIRSRFRDSSPRRYL